LKEGAMSGLLNNRKDEKLPSKNSFRFNIRDESRMGGHKMRTVVFSSEFDSGNLLEVKKLEDFKVIIFNSPLFILTYKKYQLTAAADCQGRNC